MLLPRTFVMLLSVAIAQPGNASCEIYESLPTLHALASKQVEMIKSTGETYTGPVRGAGSPSLFKRPRVYEVATKFGDVDTKSDSCIFDTRYGNPYLLCSFYFDEINQNKAKFEELAQCASQRSWEEVFEISGGVALKTFDSLYNIKGDYRPAALGPQEGEPKWIVDFSYSRRGQ